MNTLTSVLSALLLCLLVVKCQATHSTKRSTVFKSVRKCVKETGIDYKTITHYLKGNFSEDTEKAKCFLKCFANDLEFWIDERPQKSNILNYVDLLVKKTEGVGEIIDNCIVNDVSDDFCDHLYNVYKCFWTKTMTQPDQVHHSDAYFDNIHENELKKE